MRYEPRISPHHPTLGLIGATHPTLDISQGSLHEGEAHHSWNWAELLLQTEPQDFFLMKLSRISRPHRNWGQNWPHPTPLPSTSALLPRVKGFSHPPPCEHPFVAGLQSLTNSSSLLLSGISAYCLHPPPHTHPPWDSAQPLNEAEEWHSSTAFKSVRSDFPLQVESQWALSPMWPSNRSARSLDSQHFGWEGERGNDSQTPNSHEVDLVSSQWTQFGWGRGKWWENRPVMRKGCLQSLPPFWSKSQKAVEWMWTQERSEGPPARTHSPHCSTFGWPECHFYQKAWLFSGTTLETLWILKLLRLYPKLEEPRSPSFFLNHSARFSTYPHYFLNMEPILNHLYWQIESSAGTIRQGSQDFPGKMGVLLSPLHCLPEFITTILWGLGLSAFHSWPPVNSGSQACPRFLQIWLTALPDHLARSHSLLLSRWCVLCLSFSCTDFGGKCRAILNTPLSPSKPSLEPGLWGGHPATYVIRHHLALLQDKLVLPVSASWQKINNQSSWPLYHIYQP